MIQVRGLTKYYGHRAAIADVTFEVPAGEVLGLFGPHGAGKSTIARILAGYVSPSAGHVSIAGHDVVHDSLAARRHAGYVPQAVHLYRTMSVRAYLAFMATLYHLRSAGERVDEVMEQCGIVHVADQSASRLPRGLLQRVGLAQALLHDPEALILDEPTLGLDPENIVALRGLIRTLGIHHAIVLATHMPAEVAEVCRRVVAIDHGRVVAALPTPEFQARFVDAYA